MHLKELFSDEGAVSPVIGVILMVAITVILAAVIASVVLGVGQEAGSVAPTASLSFDYDNGASNPSSLDGNLTVTHGSGDSIASTDVYFRGANFADASQNQSWAGFVDDGYASQSSTVDQSPGVGAGDRAEFGADSDYEISVVWDDPDGDSSSTLSSDSGPDA